METVDDGIWESWSQIFADLYSTNGVKHFWSLRRQYFAPEFREYLEHDLFLRPVSKTYTPLSAGNVPG